MYLTPIIHSESHPTMSLKTYLIRSYGEESAKAANQLKTLRKRSAIAKSQWIFLARCHFNKVLPKSFRSRPVINTHKGRNATFLHNLNMLRIARDDAKFRYHKFLKLALNYKQFLSTKLTEQDFRKIDLVTEKSCEHCFVKNSNRLKDKFEDLSNCKQTFHHPKRHLKPSVLNLLKDELPCNQLSLLELGPKFVPTPKAVPHMDIITNVENAVQQLERKKRLHELSQ